jgi:hypothetical protein
MYVPFASCFIIPTQIKHAVYRTPTQWIIGVWEWDRVVLLTFLNPTVYVFILLFNYIYTFIHNGLAMQFKNNHTENAEYIYY